MAGQGGKRRPSSPCSCDCQSRCPFTSCPFVHEPPSAGRLNLFAVSGQGLQLMDRTWICPENRDAGAGGGGAGSGGLQHWRAAKDHAYICTAAPRGILDTRPSPAPPLPLHPPARQLLPLIPSSLEEETCTQAPSWQDVLGLGGGSLQCHSGTVVAPCTPRQLLQETSWVGSKLRMWSPHIPHVEGGK